ncbi:MAG: ABC transporter permease, partial [Thermoplasmata archaeon]|nr:ABC transporter permease [Thermoplasmata archaeon]
MEISELFLPLLVLGIIIVMLVLGLFNKVIAKLGLRNFTRHKGHSAISIAGLLVGTSIICASLVVGDSIEYFIVEDTYDELYLVDMVISSDNGPFNETIFDALYNDDALNDLTDGMAPLYVQSVSLRDEDTGQFEPSATVIGFDADMDADFGNFILRNGDEEPGDDLGTNDAIINAALAESLDASMGDTLLLTYSLGSSYMGYGGEIHSRTLTIKYISDDVGKTRFNPSRGMSIDTYNVFVNMDTAQDMFQQPGMYTNIKISNNGEVQDSVDGSEEVWHTIMPLVNQTFTGSDMLPIVMPGQTFSILSHGNLVESSLVLMSNGTVIPAADYEINEVTGAITFTVPQEMGTIIFADYDFAYPVEVSMEKQDRLEMAQNINEMLSTFLTIFGSFAILAGVILIINIFTMLAEERKSEMGMARAVGMKRKHLMQSFLFEGLAYGAVASALGTLAGVGIGAFLIYLINNIASMLAGIEIPFHFETFSLIKAFSLGFIITFGTILLTSWKISKLNIIRAIRGIEEPEKSRKGWKAPVMGIMLLLMSIVFYMEMWDEFLVKMLTPSGMMVGIALILWRWVGDRITISSASLGVFLYTYYSIRTYFGDAGMGDMELPFIMSGILIVLSMVLLIMYNSRPIIMLIVNTVGGFKKFRPTVMTAVSYPLTKKFRTGMSVAMFALVVYMIVMLSVFSNIFVMDLDEETLKQGGGYDIFAQAQVPVMDIYNVSYSPMENVTIDVTSDALDYTTITQIAATISINVDNLDAEDDDSNGGPPIFGFSFMSGTMVYGIDQDFHDERSFEFTQMMEEFDDEDDIWDSVTVSGSRNVIFSSMGAMMAGISAGDHVTFETFTGNITDEYHVVGIVDQNILTGAIMSRENI